MGGVQKVILYNKGPEPIVYTTAYDEDQVADAMANCIERHGRESSVRVLDANDIPPRG